MKKIILIGSVAMMIVSYSCKKSEMTSPGNPAVQGNAIQLADRKKGGLCVENNVNTLSNTNGEWSCPSPAKDCGKISPCSALSGGGSGGSDQLHVEDLSGLDAAIENGTLSEYVSAPDGANFLKRLLG